MEKEKSRAQQLADELLYQAPDVFEARPELKEAAWAFCEGYRHFLNRAKTCLLYTSADQAEKLKSSAEE